MKLSDFITTKDFIECVESYPFTIRNLLTEAKSYHIKRHSGQTVDYQIDLELTTMENVGTIHNSNVNAPMTEWKMHEKFETYKWISDRACEIANDLSKKMAKAKFKTIDCWGVYYRDNDYTQRHSHWPCIYAFAYYLKVPTKPAPIIFPTANYEYNPKVGDLVLFPGQIQHEVKPVEGERIMISGNLIVDYDNK